MGRLRIPVAVLSVTTLVKPSFPVSMSLITTFFHTRGGGVNCLLSQALVHQFEHLAEYFSIYFSVGVDEDSHGTSVSTIVICWTHNHFDKRFEDTSSKLWSGRANNEVPIRKWSGVNTWRCSGLLDKEHIGLEFNPLNPELNPICYLLALLGAHRFLHVRGLRVKSLTIRLLMSYIYGAPLLDVSRSHTTTQHSR